MVGRVRSVIVVMGLVLVIVRLKGSPARFRTFFFFAGFLLGMLAMLIAVHHYRYN